MRDQRYVRHCRWTSWTPWDDVDPIGGLRKAITQDSGGDSLATVHFSIGSGTKLALEDSIALFHALRQTNSLQDALIQFESFRRPVVEEYQEAAYESLLFFENLKDYMHLDPVPFAYKLMTRSGKIDIENLRRRDPAFVAMYEEYGK